MLYRLYCAEFLLALACIAWSPGALAQLPLQKMKVDLPSQDLSTSLTEFGREAGLEIEFSPESVRGKKAPAVTGELDRNQVLTRLLRGSALTYRMTTQGVVVVEPSKNGSDGKETSITAAPPGAAAGADVESSGPEQRNAVANGTSLEEIMVTAQKRSERLQDVPVPVTVLDTDLLAERSQDRLQDYFATVPGLNLAQVGSGQQTIAIRGISTSYVANPTVGFTIDDVPYGSSTLLGFGSTVLPDLDPGDLADIEVLRGPQGTLYGASSLGGLIKFETKDPITTALTGRVQIFGDAVDAGEAGFGARASVNIPLSDTFAIRASGFARRDPGYVDNVATGQSDINRAEVYGGQLTALWRPAANFSLKLSAILQDTEANGTNIVDTDVSLHPLFGGLTQSRPFQEPYSVAVRLFSGTGKVSFGGVDLTSVSGFGDNIYHQIVDSTGIYGSAAETYFSVPNADYINDFETKKFTQELRLSSSDGHRLEWLVGAFYTHESSSANQFAAALTSDTGSQVGRPIDFNFPTTVSEYALFGDLTLHFTDQFDIQVGGRESKNKQIYNETDSGPLTTIYFGAPSPYVNATERSDQNAFTYLLTPRFKISQDLMLYARLTSGYRVGGNNVNAVVGDVPSNFKPDKTNNYELGVKGDLFDRLLTFDASAYYIRWQDIQLNLYAPNTGFTYNVNGGSAKSQGLELSVQAKPIAGLSVGVAMSLNDAHLTQNFSAASSAIGFAGDPLPYSSRVSGSFTLDDEFALLNNWKGYAGGVLTYVGERRGEFVSIFSPTQPRSTFPAYANLDFHAGAKSDAWTLNLFVNNAANRRGIVGGGANIFNGGYDAIFIQPRTTGLSITRSF